MTRRGWFLFAAMCIIWGLPYLLIKVAVAELSPVVLVVFRTGIGALLLLPVAAARHQLRPLLPAWRFVALYTVVEVGIPWVLLSDAERQLSSSLSGLLVSAVPLVGAALALAGGGADRLDRRQLAGLLVGLAGVATLLGLDVGGGSLGALIELGVVTVCYATGPVIISRRLSHLPVTGVVAVSLGLVAAAYAPVAATQLPGAVPGTRVLVAVIALAVVCTALAFILFFALIAAVGPVRATIITYVNPAVAVLLGVGLLGERFTAATAVGFVLILSGSFLSTRSRPGPEAPSTIAPPPSTADQDQAQIGAAEVAIPVP